MSKGLEALETIKHTTDLDRPNELNGYHNEINIIEKELKALEVINAKEVDLFSIKYTASLEMYNYRMKTSGFAYAHRLLTQEEFDILKEVLGNDNI